MMDTGGYIGKQIGNYRIVAELASGAFGRVYRGEHVILTGRVVAFKLLHTAHLGSQKERERFLQEAQLLEKLKHPYILPLLDVGLSEGFPYLVAEFAARGSLRNRIKLLRPKPLPMEEALLILSQIGQALQHAHQQNIIHRDLKPENILFNAKGEALLADFGIATMLASASMKSVDSAGTPAYMAPEQYKGMICKESDQYALGCIAYELLTGHQPFTAPDFLSMAFKHMTEEPASPQQINPKLPEHIEQAILKALAKQRQDRFSDVAAFIAALQPRTSIQPHPLHDADLPHHLPSLPLPVPSTKTKEQWLDEAILHHQAGRYPEALSACERAIHLDRNFAYAHNAKALALYYLQRYREALQTLERAIQLDANDATPHYAKGLVLEQTLQHPEAVTAYEQAIKLDPNYTSARKKLVSIRSRITGYAKE